MLLGGEGGQVALGDLATRGAGAVSAAGRPGDDEDRDLVVHGAGEHSLTLQVARAVECQHGIDPARDDFHRRESRKVLCLLLAQTFGF